MLAFFFRFEALKHCLSFLTLWVSKVFFFIIIVVYMVVFGRRELQEAKQIADERRRQKMEEKLAK